MTATESTPRLEDRHQLIGALRFASVIEQMLACEYLFAAFSAKKTLADYPPALREDPLEKARAQAELDTIRPWLAQTYTVARQEMEHLGIVQNLFAALGEEPFFMRPAFPVSAQDTFLHAPFQLGRFSPEALKLFVWYERPDYLTAELIRRHGNPSERDDLADVDSFFVPDYLRSFDSVTKLYEAIKTAFTTLPADEIFTGDPARQVGPELFGYRVKMESVTNRATAAAAIDLVLEQGEGIGETPTSEEPAHFERFLAILSGLEEAIAADKRFDPALPVGANPWIHEEGVGVANVNEKRITRVTNPHSRRAMRLFNESYSLMLVMMKSFFGTYSGIYQPQPRPQAAMFYAAFFPLMTMVIRPLGEILARMPAHGRGREPRPGEKRAGASFEITADILEQPQDSRGEFGPVVRTVLDADYYRDALQRQAAMAKTLIDRVPRGQRDNMRYLHENLSATAGHLESIWNHGR